MIQIKNLQRIKRINKAKITKKTKNILKILGLHNAYVFLVFCDNIFIKRLNFKYFKRKNATDVISFPIKDKFAPGFLGEVVISVEETIKNTQVYHTSFDSELTLYIIHGILHLLGWRDYRKRDRLMMGRKQEEILKELIAASHKPGAAGHKLEA